MNEVEYSTAELLPQYYRDFASNLINTSFSEIRLRISLMRREPKKTEASLNDIVMQLNWIANRNGLFAFVCEILETDPVIMSDKFLKHIQRYLKSKLTLQELSKLQSIINNNKYLKPYEKTDAFLW